MKNILTSGYTYLLLFVSLVTAGGYALFDYSRVQAARELKCIESNGMVVMRNNNKMCVKVDGIIKGVF